ncbi:F-box protein At5g07610-like isoform X1 [Nicotiana tabacum]|uniref:F-box protein At5g07610-like isoform X1 n=2 Tax=Nicotiana TaxID=4085 RepID=A0A1S4BV69_TOBAC|nr:PREDICTED: F-box protein At5g07610-like isoform X1 [Nicotiana sylvestris]XP_016492760.1 PREDICTED: F-box protein At5g07610-like isoform X1 [Nicotiana tabacum]
MVEERHMHKRLAATAAVDVIAGNADLLSQILLHLPARSLIRFSPVCKLWFSIITSMQFRLSHSRTLAFSNTLTPSGIYFYNCLTNLQKVESLPLTANVTSLPPLQLVDHMAATLGDTLKDLQVKDTQVKITQSCNGLLMCVITCKTGVSNIRRGIVYNPANKGCHLLPTPYDNKYSEVVCYNLIVDPLEPPYYKAVRIKHVNTYSSNIEVSVYVPGSESWRSCCRFSRPFGMHFDSGVFWNGAIHWIGEYSFISFDVKSEEIAMKNMPARPQGDCTQKIRYFGEWGGHLHLIQVQSLHAKKFIVLELDKDTWRWSVKYRVHLARLISAFPEMVQQTSSGTQYAFSILSVIRGEKEEDSVLLLTIPGKLIAYNLVLKTVEVVRELPGEIGDTLRFNHASAYHYNESLIPVKK